MKRTKSSQQPKPLPMLEKSHYKELKQTILLSLLVFAIFVVWNIIFLSPTDIGKFFLEKWDITHYLTISSKGYFGTSSCPDNVNTVPCGNLGWFPGWPVFIWMLSKITTISQRLIIQVVPAFCFMFSLIVIGVTLRKFLTKNQVFLTQLAFLGMPGSFYFLTGFPYAFLMLLQSLYVYVFITETFKFRKLILVVLGVWIGATYPTGVFFSIIPALYILLPYYEEFRKGEVSLKTFRDWTTLLRKIFPDLLLLSVPFGLGVVCYFAELYRVFGDFFILSKFQEAHYHRALTWPWDGFILMYKSAQFYPFWQREAIELVWVFGFFPIVFDRIKFHRFFGVEHFLFFMVVIFLSISTGRILCTYRHYIALYPMLFMLPFSKRPWWLKLAWMLIGVGLNFFYFQPMYIQGGLM